MKWFVIIELSLWYGFPIFKQENCEANAMKVIRYAINKKDLHTILNMIGVLRQNERLLAVENVDLIDDNQEIVVVTVAVESHAVSSLELKRWTDKELNERYTQLAILDSHHQKERAQLLVEMERIRAERHRRSFDTEVTLDGIPEPIDRKISDQIETLLYGRNPDDER